MVETCEQGAEAKGFVKQKEENQDASEIIGGRESRVTYHWAKKE